MKELLYSKNKHIKLKKIFVNLIRDLKIKIEEHYLNEVML